MSRPAPLQSSPVASPAEQIVGHSPLSWSGISLLAVFFFLPVMLTAQPDSTIETGPIAANGPPVTFEAMPGIKSIAPADADQKRKRQWLIGGVHALGYGGSLILLNSAWYKDYERTSFHTFNDSKEWLQVDKVGHAWTVYNTSKVSAGMWKWAGLPPEKAALVSSAASLLYLTGIEFMDSRSAKWGWSWSDMAANIAGSGLFVGQEYLWHEQRLQLKFSFHRNNYDEDMLEQRADDLFGKSWYERMLKDYNAQTYWLSANIRTFLPGSTIPAWLNLAAGLGAEGMFGGFANEWTDELGNEINRSDIPRKRQFYLSPDIDFTRIKTGSKLLRTVFFFLNAFKCPAPAIMIDSKGKLKGYLIYF